MPFVERNGKENTYSWNVERFGNGKEKCSKTKIRGLFTKKGETRSLIKIIPITLSAGFTGNYVWKLWEMHRTKITSQKLCEKLVKFNEYLHLRFSISTQNKKNLKKVYTETELFHFFSLNHIHFGLEKKNNRRNHKQIGQRKPPKNK